MTTVDERLAFVEGRVAEHSEMFSDLRNGILSLERRMDVRMDRVEGHLNELRAEMSRNCRWVVGIQVTTLITVVAALLGALSVR